MAKLQVVKVGEKLYSSKIPYSTEERKIGTWVDGKPLYRKTIIITNTALQSGNNVIPHGISDLKTCVKHELAKDGGQIFPYFNLDNNNNLQTGTFLALVNSTHFNIRIFGDSWGAQNIWYVTLYYTKTTD